MLDIRVCFAIIAPTPTKVPRAALASDRIRVAGAMLQPSPPFLLCLGHRMRRAEVEKEV